MFQPEYLFYAISVDSYFAFSFLHLWIKYPLTLHKNEMLVFLQWNWMLSYPHMNPSKVFLIRKKFSYLRWCNNFEKWTLSVPFNKTGLEFWPKISLVNLYTITLSSKSKISSNHKKRKKVCCFLATKQGFDSKNLLIEVSPF